MIIQKHYKDSGSIKKKIALHIPFTACTDAGKDPSLLHVNMNLHHIQAKAQHMV